MSLTEATRAKTATLPSSLLPTSWNCSERTSCLSSASPSVTAAPRPSPTQARWWPRGLEGTPPSSSRLLCVLSHLCWKQSTRVFSQMLPIGDPSLPSWSTSATSIGSNGYAAGTPRQSWTGLSLPRCAPTLEVGCGFSSPEVPAPLAPDAHDFCRTCLGITLLQGYGLTETCATASIPDGSDLITGRVGPPLQDVGFLCALKSLCLSFL